MKTPLTAFVLAGLSLLVAACESGGMAARVQEKAVVYNKLEPWEQRDIQNGVVGIGNSTDMVYMALGKPSKIVTSADGSETTWTYNNYYPPTSVPSSHLNLSTTGKAGYTSAVNSTSGGLGSTSTRGTAQTDLSAGELPADTFYVTFSHGQVVRTQLESEKK